MLLQSLTDMNCELIPVCWRISSEFYSINPSSLIIRTLPGLESKMKTDVEFNELKTFVLVISRAVYCSRYLVIIMIQLTLS